MRGSRQDPLPAMLCACVQEQRPRLAGPEAGRMDSSLISKVKAIEDENPRLKRNLARVTKAMIRSNQGSQSSSREWRRCHSAHTICRPARGAAATRSASTGTTA